MPSQEDIFREASFPSPLPLARLLPRPSLRFTLLCFVLANPRAFSSPHNTKQKAIGWLPPPTAGTQPSHEASSASLGTALGHLLKSSSGGLREKALEVRPPLRVPLLRRLDCGTFCLPLLMYAWRPAPCGVQALLWLYIGEDALARQVITIGVMSLPSNLCQFPF